MSLWWKLLQNKRHGSSNTKTSTDKFCSQLYFPFSVNKNNPAPTDTVARFLERRTHSWKNTNLLIPLAIFRFWSGKFWKHRVISKADKLLLPELVFPKHFHEKAEWPHDYFVQVWIDVRDFSVFSYFCHKNIQNLNLNKKWQTWR